LSITDAIRFAKDLVTDKDLTEKIKAKASGLTSLVELGKAHGYNFTLEEIKQVIRSGAPREMTDDQLDAVAGGKAAPPAGSPPATTAVLTGPAAVNVATHTVTFTQTTTMTHVVIF
jgi:predicted ribosomally synthesized peptide with nif11-like leader